MEARIVLHTEIDPEKWDEFVLASPQGMIYSCFHYISGLEKSWAAVFVSSGETLHAVMPFSMRKKAGISLSTQPIFTQYWGIMFRPSDANTARYYEQKRQWSKLIIETLPKDIRLFNHNFSPDFDYPLPFHWAGYKLSPRYSNQIELGRNEEELWSNISEKTRGHIRKCEKEGLNVVHGTEVEKVIRIFRKAKDGKIKSFTDDTYRAITSIAGHYAAKGHCHTLVAKDSEGKDVAGCIYFKFRNTTIHFLGSTDPEYKGRSAMALVVWKAILRAKAEGYRIFDFEGSMIEPVEQFFLSFGSKPTLYLQVMKNDLPPALKLLYKLRQG